MSKTAASARPATTTESSTPALRASSRISLRSIRATAAAAASRWALESDSLRLNQRTPSHRGMPTGCSGQANERATMQSKMAPWAFVLAVPDMNRSAEYFRDVLGFRTSWEDATDWRLAERDGVRIMLGQCPTDMHPSALGSHNWFGYL